MNKKLILFLNLVVIRCDFFNFSNEKEELAKAVIEDAVKRGYILKPRKKEVVATFEDLFGDNVDEASLLLYTNEEIRLYLLEGRRGVLDRSFMKIGERREVISMVANSFLYISEMKKHIETNNLEYFQSEYFNLAWGVLEDDTKKKIFKEATLRANLNILKLLIGNGGVEGIEKETLSFEGLSALVFYFSTLTFDNLSEKESIEAFRILYSSLEGCESSEIERKVANLDRKRIMSHRKLIRWIFGYYSPFPENEATNLREVTIKQAELLEEYREEKKKALGNRYVDILNYLLLNLSGDNSERARNVLSMLKDMVGRAEVKIESSKYMRYELVWDIVRRVE